MQYHIQYTAHPAITAVEMPSTQLLRASSHRGRATGDRSQVTQDLRRSRST